MLHISGAKGFGITFPNGITVSVQFGPGSYCEKRHEPFGSPIAAARESGVWASEDAEIAIFRDPADPAENNEYITSQWDASKGDPNVAGWCSPTDVASAIAWAASQP